MALAIGDQDNVACTRCHHSVECTADLGATSRPAQLADVGAPLFAVSLAQIADLIVKLPQMQVVALAQVIGGLAEAEQCGSMLGETGVGRAQLIHGSRTIDQYRSTEEPIPGWRWLNGEGDAPPVGGAAQERPGAPALDLDVDGRIEGNTRLAVSKLAAEQQDFAGVGCDLEIRSLCATAVAQLIAVRQSRLPVDVANGRRNMQQDAVANPIECDGKTRGDGNFAPGRNVPHRQQVHAFDELLVQDAALFRFDGVLISSACGRLGACHGLECATRDASFEAIEDSMYWKGKRQRRFDALLLVVAEGSDRRHIGEAATNIDVIGSGDEGYRPGA